MSKIDFQKVKKQVPVSAFFEGVMNLKPKKMNTGVRYGGCPACGESQDPMSLRVSVRSNKWKCFSCGEGGDVIDAAGFFYGLGQVQAAEALIGKNSGMPETVKNWKLKATSALQPERIIDPQVTKEVIHRLLEQGNRLPLDKQVYDYLRSRSISDEAIQTAREQNALLSLPSSPERAKKYLEDVIGRPLLEEAGMWKAGAKAPGMAYRPLAFVTANGKSIEFRLIRAADEKEVKLISYGPMNPFFIQGSHEDEFVITEGMTDLLSVLTFKSKKNLIGLPGCQRFAPSWFSKMAGRDVLLALDADAAAKKALHKPNGLVKTLQDAQARVSIFQFNPDFIRETPDTKNQDINGFLQWRMSKMQ